MNHGARGMSDKGKREDGPDDATERELIDLEFQSMVEGLALDQSAPTSYLDELDKFVDQNKFTPPNPPQKKFSQTIKSALGAIKKWKNAKGFRDDDGAAL